MMSAVSVGMQSVVLLLRSCHCFGLTVKHKIDCEGEFLPCYEVLTLSGRQYRFTERILADVTLLKLPFAKELWRYRTVFSLHMHIPTHLPLTRQ